ncbi:MAG: type IV toxin-antitoxin system AbiEi family antitoxin [Eubacteriales bacterium]
MNLYFKLLQKPVFTAEYVNQYYNNIESTRSALKRLMKQNMIIKIRNNLYTCISGETGAPVASRFQIACMITDSAYISHHTAIEYHGLSDQVYYDVYVSSKTRFHDFEFDGYTYKFVATKMQTGVENVQYSGGIRVTDLEKTLVDSIKDMDKITGIEEVISFIQSVRKLREQKLLQYLVEYQNQFLYQKIGYLLETYNRAIGLSEQFYMCCQEHIGKSRRYLSKDIYQGRYNERWKIVVEINAQEYQKNGEIIEDDRI